MAELVLDRLKMPVERDLCIVVPVFVGSMKSGTAVAIEP